ncbi:MAG TPA: hypothetical protein PLV45_07230, partial [bacterium]|nr:hypothetical protein [bacterium]
ILNPGLPVPDPSTLPVVIDPAYFGPGYGERTAESQAAERWMEAHGPVPVDPTYTAKTLAAVFDSIAGGGFGTAPVLYWHTFDSGHGLNLE